MALPLLLGQLLALAGGGGAFYLEVRELEEKCFIQEIPDGTVVRGARAPPVPALPYPTQSPEREWEMGPADQPRGGRGWETGGQLCGQSTLCIACAGAGDTEEARVTRFGYQQKSRAGEGKREAEGCGQTPQPDQIFPFLHPPPPL